MRGAAIRAAVAAAAALIVRRGVRGVGAGAAVAAVLAAGASGQGSPQRTLVFASGGDGVSDRLELAVVSPGGGRMRRLTRHVPSGVAPTWTSGDRHIVYVTADQFTGQTANWKTTVDGSRAWRLPGDAWDNPSPDGRRVAILEDWGVAVVDDRGRTVRRVRLRLGSDEYYLGPAQWSPDGHWLAIGIYVLTRKTSYDRFVVVATQTPSRRRAFGAGKNGSEFFFDSWSQSGTAFTFTAAGSLYRVGVGGGRRHLVDRKVGPTSASWAPDGRRLTYVGRLGGIYVKGAGASRRIVRTLADPDDGLDEVSVFWSPRGDLIAYTDVGGTYIVSPDGSGRRKILPEDRHVGPLVSWSRDGRRLAYSLEGEIFTARVAGGRPRPVTRTMWDGHATWSPDGSRVAFDRQSASSNDEVYVIDADGRRARRVGFGSGPRWSPEGGRLAFDTPNGLVVADLSTGSQQLVGKLDKAAWSPDGRTFAYMKYDYSDTAASATLLVAQTDGSDARPVVKGSCESFYSRPAWSPDAALIALVVIPDDRRDCADYPNSRLALVDAATGEVRFIADTPTRSTDCEICSPSVVWSRDGSRLTYTYGRHVGVVARDGTDHRVIAPVRKEVSYTEPRWSPDGRRVAFIEVRRHRHEGEPPTETADVYVVDADGTRKQRLTRTPGVEVSLDWAAR